MDDAELVERIRAGDHRAWEDLVDRHSAMLWRLARSIVNDNDMASDAMQTAWLALLQHVDRISQPAAVKGWLATTVRREAIALSKSLARQRATDPLDWSFDQPTSPQDDPGVVAAQSDQHSTVMAEFRKLGERCQQLLTMLAHKIVYDTIAQVLDIAVGSIGPTRARCLEQLRRLPAIARLEAV